MQRKKSWGLRNNEVQRVRKRNSKRGTCETNSINEKTCFFNKKCLTKNVVVGLKIRLDNSLYFNYL